MLQFYVATQHGVAQHSIVSGGIVLVFKKINIKIKSNKNGMLMNQTNNFILSVQFYPVCAIYGTADAI